ncbi:MAG: hypothetical protein OXE95_02365 [Chloroflexi bacterium]|nr:hypothetical protein [Chloroflexota bacterium]MCY4246407.1 hypothetical protein [Chloroflexota bacterium]
MKIALISSLYRCEKHLPTFSAALFGFAKRVSQAGVAVDYLPIVNDASQSEREQIDKLARAINSGCHGRMTPQYIPRESLYASWNRGLANSDADGFGFWNADDTRAADAFLAGWRALQDGADLVDFDFTRVATVRRMGRFARTERWLVPCLYNPARFSRGNGLGPFFMARRSLYAAVGPFDANFQIAGDTEWASRAVHISRFQRIPSSGGDFIVHGENLSNTGSGREDIEVNIIHMRRGNWRELRPADPAAMRAAWQLWGRQGQIELPAEHAEYLWGAGAKTRWRAYRREQRQPRWLRRLRLALAARGWLHSEEWVAARRGAARS